MHMHIAHADWVQINSEEAFFVCAAAGISTFKFHTIGIFKIR